MITLRYESIRAVPLSWILPVKRSACIFQAYALFQSILNRKIGWHWFWTHRLFGGGRITDGHLSLISSEYAYILKALYRRPEKQKIHRHDSRIRQCGNPPLPALMAAVFLWIFSAIWRHSIPGIRVINICNLGVKAIKLIIICAEFKPIMLWE